MYSSVSTVVTLKDFIWKIFNTDDFGYDTPGSLAWIPANGYRRAGCHKAVNNPSQFLLIIFVI